MTKRQGKSGTIDVKALLAEDEGFLRTLVRAALQEVLEAEMTEAWAPRRASGAQAGWAIGRSGYYGRTLILDSRSDRSSADPVFDKLVVTHPKEAVLLAGVRHVLDFQTVKQTSQPNRPEAPREREQKFLWMWDKPAATECDARRFC